MIVMRAALLILLLLFSAVRPSATSRLRAPPKSGTRNSHQLRHAGPSATMADGGATHAAPVLAAHTTAGAFPSLPAEQRAEGLLLPTAALQTLFPPPSSEGSSPPANGTFLAIGLLALVLPVAIVGGGWLHFSRRRVSPLLSSDLYLPDKETASAARSRGMTPVGSLLAQLDCLRLLADKAEIEKGGGGAISGWGAPRGSLALWCDWCESQLIRHCSAVVASQRSDGDMRTVRTALDSMMELVGAYHRAGQADRLATSPPWRSLVRFVTASIAELGKGEGTAAADNSNGSSLLTQATLAEIQRDLEPLGQSTFGVVHVAAHKEKSVSINIIKLSTFCASRADREAVLGAYAAELSVLVRLRHDNVLAVYPNIVQGNGDLLFGMEELAGGGSLRHLLDTQPEAVTSAVGLRMMVEIAGAAEYLHSHGTTHLNLKAATIMLDIKRNVKLSGFGLSRTEELLAGRGKAPGDSPVRASPWHPPEARCGAKGWRRSPAIDAYGFGVVMWETVTKKQVPRIRAATGSKGGDAEGEEDEEGCALPLPEGLGNLGDVMESCWCIDPAARPTFARIGADLRALFLADD